MERTWINRYAAGGPKLTQAIAGLPPALLQAPPPAGSRGAWTIQQIVLHLCDSDLIAADRMKRVIAEENPTLIGFDEGRFAANLYYAEQSATDAAKIFALNRRQTAIVLRCLPDAAFDRIGTHNEAGVLTLAKLLQSYTEHLEHHLAILLDKRQRLEALSHSG